MAQIAQQDHLFIEVSTLETFTDAQKAKLIECYKAGTILDVVLRAATGVGKSISIGKSISKCISAGYKDVGTTRTYAFIFGDTTPVVITAEETIPAV